MPSGTTNLRGVAISPDGRWAYVVHTMGKFMLPTTQLDRGWVNTNALTIVDVKGASVYCTMLLDLLSEGAADPWGVALSKDGKTLWVTLAGAQQIAKVDLGRLHPLLEGKVPKANTPNLAPADLEFARRLEVMEPYRNAGVQNTWFDIATDPKKRDLLATDLTALHVAEVMTRATLGEAKGPRGLALSPDGSRLAVAAYFSGQVLTLDSATLAATGAVDLGPQKPVDDARRGEMIFHDGTYCFQHWLSCSTCHPSARSDGLSWDLVDDGMGNLKSTRNLLLAQCRSPLMARGVRGGLEDATIAGFKHILFRQPESPDVAAVDQYVRSLEPLASPRLVNGQLSRSGTARQGDFR